MENIGRNMAWMLKTLEYSRAAVPLPEKYLRTSTNFIRIKCILRAAPLVGKRLFR